MNKLTKSASGSWLTDDGDALIEDLAELHDFLDGLPEGAELYVRLPGEDEPDDDED